MATIFEKSTGIDVYAAYGPRDTGNVVGVEPRLNNKEIIGLQLMWNNTVYSTGTDSVFQPPAFVPAGFLVERAYVVIEETASGWSDVEVGWENEDEEFNVIFTIPAATLNNSAPMVTVITTEAEPISTLAEDGKYMIKFRHTSETEPTSGRIAVTLEGEAKVTTGYGPYTQPPVFEQP